MAATDFLYPRYPLTGGAEIPVKNTSGGALAAGALVKIDSANPVSASQAQIGVIPTAAVGDFPFGVLVTALAANAVGPCQVEGVIPCIALGAIAAGAIVGPSATAGQVTTYTAANPNAGQALTAAANAADPVLVRLSIGKNA